MFHGNYVPLHQISLIKREATIEKDKREGKQKIEYGKDYCIGKPERWCW